MANQPINDPVTYSEVLRLLETTDLVHKDTFNPLFARLINNDAFIKAFTEQLANDIFAGGFVVSGMTSSKNAGIATQLDVTSGICYVQQASGGILRFTPAADDFATADPSTTYYLDFQPDGTYSWGTAHSAQANYIPVAEVATDVLGQINTVTDRRTVKATDVYNLLMSHTADYAHHYAADTGITDAYVVTLNPTPTAYVVGMVVTFKAANTNTGASTINVNGLGIKTIKKNITADLSAGDIPAGAMLPLVYDGTYFQLIATPGIDEIASINTTTATASVMVNLDTKYKKIYIVFEHLDTISDAVLPQIKFYNGSTVLAMKITKVAVLNTGTLNYLHGDSVQGAADLVYTYIQNEQHSGVFCIEKGASLGFFNGTSVTGAAATTNRNTCNVQGTINNCNTLNKIEFLFQGYSTTGFKAKVLGAK